VLTTHFFCEALFELCLCWPLIFFCEACCLSCACVNHSFFFCEALFELCLCWPLIFFCEALFELCMCWSLIFFLSTTNRACKLSVKKVPIANFDTCTGFCNLARKKKCQLFASRSPHMHTRIRDFFHRCQVTNTRSKFTKHVLAIRRF